MEKDYNRIKETFKKFQNTGDKSEFLEEVSLKILNFSKESNNEEFEEYISDVFLKFQNQFSNFVNSFTKSKHENLSGFLYLYLKNLFLNEYKYDRNKTIYPLNKLYELEEHRQKSEKVNSKENEVILDLISNKLNSLERLVLFLRYDIQICEFDLKMLKKKIEKSNYTFEEVISKIQEKRNKIRKNEREIINKINIINTKIYNRNLKVYKFDLYSKKKALYQTLCKKKNLLSITETCEILGVSGYKLIRTNYKFKKIMKLNEIEVQVA
jgi:hypothetical protein